MKRYLCATIVAFCLLPLPASAASHYIRQGATESGSGNDWTNAYTELPASLIRGDTYYMAGGSYSGRNFDTPTSGTTAITIKGATIADHGTDSGWDVSYAVDTAPAFWTSPISFTTSYWTFSGSVGSMSKFATDYGFTLVAMQHPIAVGSPSTNVTDVTIAHVAATAPPGDIEKFFVSTGNTYRKVDHVTIAHCFLDGWQNGYWATSPLGPSMPNESWIFEYNVCLNGYSSPAQHGEWVNNNYATHEHQITRYNLFEGHSGTACMTGIVVANNADNNHAEIYGNVFNDISACNGTITGTSNGDLNNARVYNNTIVNSSSGVATLNGPGSGNVAYNNLLYNDRDYDGRLLTALNFSGFTGTNNLLVTTDPFVDPSSDFHLRAGTAPIDAGAALTSDGFVERDMDGHLRGADGAWDVGAYELTSDPAAGGLLPPQNLHISN